MEILLETGIYISYFHNAFEKKKHQIGCFLVAGKGLKPSTSGLYHAVPAGTV
jgi:hypothetical protein